MTTNTKEDVIRKIRALLAKAESTFSEAEALACAAKAKQLMAKHEVSEEDVSDERIGSVHNHKRISDTWRQWLAVSTARWFNCAVIREEFERTNRSGDKVSEIGLVYIGRKSDALVAQLMTDHFVATVSRLANEYCKKDKARGQNEWRKYAKGCALRLAQRIYELSKKQTDNRQLELVEQHLAKMALREGRKGGSITLAGDAALAGHRAAENIGLNLQATTDRQGNTTLTSTKALAHQP